MGQPSRFIHCTKYTTLADELSRLVTDRTTRVVVISCLTNIVVNLTGTSDIPKSIERAMGSLGNVIKDVLRSNSGLRIFISQCTPRNIEGFKEFSTLALVSYVKLFRDNEK